MYKLNLEKVEEPEIKLPTSTGSQKKNKEVPPKIYFCFTDYTKAFDCVDHNKLREILQEMGIPEYLICVLRNLQIKKQQLELDMEQQTDSKLEKEYIKAVFCNKGQIVWTSKDCC